MPQSHQPSSSLPPKEHWSASASNVDGRDCTPDRAIDGDLSTRWNSVAVDPQWWQLDLGQLAQLTGVAILWEAAFARDWDLLASRDGNEWQTIASVREGSGGTEYLFFAPVDARFVRVLGLRRGSGWGYSIRDFQLFGMDFLPEGPAELLWSPTRIDHDATLDLKREVPIAGVRIDWGAILPDAVQLLTSPDGNQWQLADSLPNPSGDFDILGFDAKPVRWIRLVPSGLAEIKRLTLRGPDHPVTKLVRYQTAAQKAPRGLYPDSMRGQQVYWTMLGMQGDYEQSLLDEYGALEPWSKGCTLMPYIAVRGELHSAITSSEVRHTLTDGCLPLPKIVFTAAEIDVEIDAMTGGEVGIGVKIGVFAICCIF